MEENNGDKSLFPQGRQRISLMLPQLWVIFRIIWYLVCRLSYCNLFCPVLMLGVLMDSYSNIHWRRGKPHFLPGLSRQMQRGWRKKKKRQLVLFNTWNEFLLQKMPNCFPARVAIELGMLLLCHSGTKPMQKGFSAVLPVPFVLLDFEKITHIVRKQHGRCTQQGNDSVSKSRKSCLWKKWKL